MLIVTSTHCTDSSSTQVVHDTVTGQDWKLVTDDVEKRAVVHRTLHHKKTVATARSEDALNIWRQLSYEATNAETRAQIGAFCGVVDDALGIPFTEPVQ